MTQYLNWYQTNMTNIKLMCSLMYQTNATNIKQIFTQLNKCGQYQTNVSSHVIWPISLCYLGSYDTILIVLSGFSIWQMPLCSRALYLIVATVLSGSLLDHCDHDLDGSTITTWKLRLGILGSLCDNCDCVLELFIWPMIMFSWVIYMTTMNFLPGSLYD